MFHALIKSEDDPRGEAMEVSGDATPYNLETLREHVLRLRRRLGALEVRLRANEEAQPRIRAGLADLDRHGIRLVFHG